MFRNYIITTLRNFRRNRVYLALNVLGLALGIGCSVVIYKVVRHELSYDGHHANYNNIYRVVSAESASVPHPLGEALRADYSFIDKVVSLDYEGGGLISSWDSGRQLHRFDEGDGLVFASPELFDVFSFPTLTGDLKKGLAIPHGAVISDAWAEKYFDCQPGNYNAVLGKTIKVNLDLEFTIHGVFEAPPATTDFPFHLVVHYHDLGLYDSDFADGKDWTSISSATNCYLLLQDKGNVGQFKSSMKEFQAKYFGEEPESGGLYRLQPLADVHFDAGYLNYSYRTFDKKLVFALAGIGFFLLLAACINFINLATAQARKRAREIGIRKVLGGHRRQLRFQFMLETAVVTILSCFLSLAIAELLLIQLRDVLGYQLSVSLGEDPGLAVYLVMVSGFVTIVAGIYPALVLSGLHPIDAIRSRLVRERSAGGFTLRKGLVVVQFIISQGLVVCTLVVVLQIRHLMEQPLGFRQDAILVTDVMPGDDKLPVLGERLKAISGVEEVSFCIGTPMSSTNASANFFDPAVPAGQRADMNANFKAIDEHYLSMFGLQLLAGRNLGRADSTRSVLVTEQVVRMLGFQDPAEALGFRVKTGYDAHVREIVGVVNDFHAYSLHRGIEPVILLYSSVDFGSVAIKLAGNSASMSGINGVIERVQEVWTDTYPDFVFRYHFFDKFIAFRYRQERNLATLFVMFTGIALVIGALGLYGLISYLTGERMKEVGVRKVLGASSFSILVLFNKEVMALLLLSMLAVVPATYFTMQHWLDSFAYRIQVSYLVFSAGWIVSAVFAVLSTVHKSMEAARINPVDLLRSE